MKFFERGALLTVVTGAVLTAFSQIAFAAAPQAGAVTGRPDHLLCDSLAEPLGLDAKQLQLSWQLHDARIGAHQTAYDIQVATKPALLAAGKADVWDSGRVASGSSVDVAYAGPALEAQTRYYWRVLVWDKDGKSYPASGMSWWETGLMSQANWQAKWIGYEEKEELSVRQSGAEWITNPGQDNFKTTGETHHAFRFGFDIEKPVRHAALLCNRERLDGRLDEWQRVAGRATASALEAGPVEDLDAHRCDAAASPGQESACGGRGSLFRQSERHAGDERKPDTDERLSVR